MCELGKYYSIELFAFDRTYKSMSNKADNVGKPCLILWDYTLLYSDGILIGSSKMQNLMLWYTMRIIAWL